MTVEVGALVLERERDRAAAGADVEHARARAAASSAASTSSSVSGPRDSTRGSTCEVDVAKALDAEDVGDRLALDRRRRTSVLERAHRRALRPSRVGSMSSARAVDAERVREQQLGVQPRRVDAGAASATTRRVERVAHRRRRASAISACCGLRLEPAALLVGLRARR